MPELASRPIGAVELFVEALAELSLIVLGHVWLGVELVEAVSEGATLFEGANASELPVLAELGLILRPESFHLWLTF